MRPNTLQVQRGIARRRMLRVALAVLGTALVLSFIVSAAPLRPADGSPTVAKVRVWGQQSSRPATAKAASEAAVSRLTRSDSSAPRALRSQSSTSSGRGLVPLPAPLVDIDPAGDTLGTGEVQIDIVEVATDTDHNSLFIDMIFNTLVSAPDSGLPDAVTGFVDIDADQNPSTGTSFVPAWGLGADFSVDLFTYSSVFEDAFLIDQNTGASVGTVPVTFFGDGLLIKVPLELLNDDGFVDVGVEVGTLTEATDIAPNQGSLASDDTVLRLKNDRFFTIIDWVDFEGNSGPGRVVPFRSDDSGMFYFFRSTNWELLIKVLRSCGATGNNHFWVFAAATTDVEYDLTVYDLFTGDFVVYENPLGVASPAITDTQAFATCP
jgi:hypothetical protein